MIQLRIYVASSWRNHHQQDVVRLLRHLGNEVYDFRNPRPGNDGFRWSDIDANWADWSPAAYRAALKHPIAVAGFASDFEAMRWADTCVLVLPAGRSASWEFGWCAGQGKRCLIYLPEPIEPELMYGGGGATPIAVTLQELADLLPNDGEGRP